MNTVKTPMGITVAQIWPDVRLKLVEIVRHATLPPPTTKPTAALFNGDSHVISLPFLGHNYDTNLRRLSYFCGKRAPANNKLKQR